MIPAVPVTAPATAAGCSREENGPETGLPLFFNRQPGLRSDAERCEEHI